MKTEHLTEPSRILSSSVVAVGSFDGLHLGHRAILDALLEESRLMGVPSVVMTFEPHPRNITRGEDVELLTVLDEKVPVISALGADYLAVLHFDKKIADMSFEDFARDYLIGSLGIKKLVMGLDHGFGKGRAGNTTGLSELGNRFGFGLRVVEPVQWNGNPIQSNIIRKTIAMGDIPYAAQMLGRPYSISGEVVEGRGRGAKLGFPTVNISVPKSKLLPPFGVYSAAEMSGNPGLLYIGESPTFEPKELSVEFHGLIKPYVKLGNNIALSVFERFRGEIAFESPEKLIEQMNKDLERLKIWVNNFL